MVTKNKLTQEEKEILVNKGTEVPFTGEYDNFYEEGIFVCRQCNLPLFSSVAKFNAHCGWPAFDDTFPNAVKEFIDADGRRTEIQCARCGGHLGHVFRGEELTSKDTRHCVNSLSIRFVPKDQTEKVLETEKMKIARIVLGGGCFWCIDASLIRVPGVVKTVVGYAGGKTEYPSYEQVCSGTTGHAEVVRVTYDANTLSLKELLHMFFTVHDPTTLNQQGSDVGTQYRSIILYTKKVDKEIIQGHIQGLQKELTRLIVTQVEKLSEFYPAEEYHQKYFEKNRDGNSYCQFVILPKVKKVEEIVEKSR